MKILVTGAAGFIGFHLSKELLLRGYEVVGVDNINSYYDISLKKARIKILEKNSINNNFILKKGNLEDSSFIKRIFSEYRPQKVVNLAAQAGVRYSLENPMAYINSNIVGFQNIIEQSKEYKVEHLVYASSSSVYGGNTSLPFSEKNSVEHPISIYAASKKANELVAHTYSHLYNLPTTGLRFFTVYGPWGRPDMALFLFTKSILKKVPIKVFNNGDMSRDFTYIDDIIESLVGVIEKPTKANKDFDTSNPDPSSSWSPYKVFNIGNSAPVSLMEYINAIESALGIKSIKEFLPMQPGDVRATFADTRELEKWTNFKPKTDIKIGIERFIKWYLDFYKVNL